MFEWLNQRVPRLSFSFRLLFIYSVLFAMVAWFIVNKSADVLDSSVRQAAEEVMIDSANFAAEMIQRDLSGPDINIDSLRKLMPRFLKREVNAYIYSVQKNQLNMNVYVTNADGMLLFDSAGVAAGEDYSKWRDVFLTLKGEYGARSTDIITEAGEEDTVMYVSAPIRWQNKIVGAVSVSKKVKQFEGFVANANTTIRRYSILLLMATLAFSGLITWWLARSIRKLVRYADGLGAGEKLSPPKFHERELQSLVTAMSDMQTELQDKQYVENYLHTLAHELKSPLTGMKGAVELLQEDMPRDRKQQFIDNIGDSAERMLLLVERLLQLAQLEKRQRLENVQSFKPAELVKRLHGGRSEVLKSKRIKLNNLIPPDLTFRGEILLIEQALANLLDNAIDFSPSPGLITIDARAQSGQYEITIRDQGQGIPAHMREKVFERFISTQRPTSRKRSTGLGLSFVREVMVLHQGDIKLINIDQGLCVQLVWPVTL